jgi:hypothetical protein
MSGFSMVLNILTILVVVLFYIYLQNNKQTVNIRIQEPTPSEIYNGMSQTKNYESIRMIEPFEKLKRDNGNTGGFLPNEGYLTYMVTL